MEKEPLAELLKMINEHMIDEFRNGTGYIVPNPPIVNILSSTYKPSPTMQKMTESEMQELGYYQ